ncbi:fatty-acyl-CoA synthase [Actinomycetospora succinea]|uniref:Fatty-acyl-CoA synthase n=1 Tax=Actinomycetospora succinea TaxID=663603 RepID=A0A4R6V9I4_9PSEU|nr:AMP-binding protein [Actinomycetospora succinea]TDQ58446.1 fatty-acyl-CoA synthase [Actinomycetospora succinea]
MATIGVDEASYRSGDTSAPLSEQTIGDALREAAAAAPDRRAVVEGAPGPGPLRTLTYGELLGRAEAVARALLGRFRPGEHVAVWSGNSLEWIELEYGAALAGLVLVTANPAYQAGEIAYVLRQSRSAGLFHVASHRGNPMADIVAEVRDDLPDLREVVDLADFDAFVAGGDPEQELPSVRPDDRVQIQYTSGTTGFPKGVLLRHHAMLENARLTLQRMSVGPGDVCVWPMPLFHTAGCGMGVLGTLTTGATIVYLTVFDPALQLALIESQRATISGGVPTMLIALLAHPDLATRDTSSLRCLFAGGSPVPPEVGREVEARIGGRMSIVFGTTETAPIVTATAPDDSDDVRLGTLGSPLPHTEVKIADPVGGEAVPVGTVGELCVRGYLVMEGYYARPEATAAVLDAAGWYHTGDLASMDRAGTLRVEGRIKDMIIRGGENIYPREIEELLQGHPAVAEVAVVGCPDPHWGETVAAFVRPAADAVPTGEELHAWCRAHLAAFKTPASWHLVDVMPVTASGKIRKNVLRDRLVTRETDAADA